MVRQLPFCLHAKKRPNQSFNAFAGLPRTNAQQVGSLHGMTHEHRIGLCLGMGLEYFRQARPHYRCRFMAETRLEPLRSSG
jgi:hypothetical protein